MSKKVNTCGLESTLAQRDYIDNNKKKTDFNKSMTFRKLINHEKS